MGVRFPLVAPIFSQTNADTPDIKKHHFSLFYACPLFHKFANIFHKEGMKRIKLLLIACFAPLALNAAVSDTPLNTSRATKRTETTNTNQSNRKKNTQANKTVKNTPARNNNSNNIERARTITSRNNESATRTRTASVSSRNARTANNVQRTTVARTATTPTRTATKRTPISAVTVSRNASIAQNSILSRDYKKCREILYSCMDEFCANKDSQLRRCACSNRINEFKNAKQSLANIEEKLLDFNQRLLTVNMDKEDAAALSQATEGELAFNTKDKSDSKKTLDEIAKKLNTSFTDNNFDTRMNAITLTLDIDSAFDNIDSLAGASTTTKSGPELYSAALPTCREMALEVCTPDELQIAESGYQMMIEQDCNTVAKSYQTQMDQAQTKILESSALLDMSRLDIHQQRNSDDILTCKTKMLNMLTDSTVCGDDLGKCLDTTGQYIDPTTGDAILSQNLVNLSTLITRPTGDQTWTSIPTNSNFITFLNTKKKFLEPAMEKCQNISSYVWDTFIEDALAQIKLAQDKKLETIRQSCTTLTTQCMDQTLDSISDFDARAISIFGILADKTVNTMCKDVRTSCEKILTYTDSESEWGTGFTEIINQNTHDTILKTCREVGRNCIVRACTSSSGNFGLCENIYTSINRKAIINRTACWDEVKECVASAGEEKINELIPNIPTKPILVQNSKYQSIKNDGYYDLCTDDSALEYENKVCRLTEQIWGNCENAPEARLTSEETNKILMTNSSTDETLLEWFAKNTGTSDKADNCRDTTCPIDFRLHKTTGACLPLDDYTSEGTYCPKSLGATLNIGTTDNGTPITNCCESGGKCSQLQHNTNYACLDTRATNYSDPLYKSKDSVSPLNLCLPQHSIIQIIFSDSKRTLVCLAEKVVPTSTGFNCHGKYVLIEDGVKYSPTKLNGANVKTFYRYESNENNYHECPNSDGKPCPIPNPTGGFIKYVQSQ